MFGGPTNDPESFQCLSHPLDSDIFLEAIFSFNEFVPNSAKDWRESAHEMREIIKSSLVLEKR
jgi:hypothetical protein